jgi:iron complex outermembrane receptor protein
MSIRRMTLSAAAATAAAALSPVPAPAAEPPAPARIETILVTAQRVAEDIASERAATPGAVTTLDADALDERGVTQLAELFRYVPGVWSESYNGNDDTFYSSRGSNLDATDYDKNGVKFLQDGLPVTTADGNNHNRAIDPMHARYVTVAHGANALAYGASTLGGAVDVVTPTARTSDPFSVSVSAGSFGQWGARATLGGVADDVDGLVSVETQQRDGYRDHSEQDRRNAYANVGWQLSGGVATRIYASYSDYYAELPRELSRAQFRDDPRQARADAIAGNHGKDVQAWRLAFRTTIAEVAGGTLEFGASHEEQSLFHPIVSLPFFSLLIDTDHEDSGAMLRWHGNAGAHDLVAGANYGHSTVEGGNYQNIGGRRGALMWTTDDNASSLELFALDRWGFAPGWTLVYGTQYVAAERDVGGLDAGYHSFNPRLGVVHALNGESEWFASVSRVYEAPTTFELTDDVNGGATALDAMHGIVAETGLRGTAMVDDNRFTWEVAGYYTALRDEILSIDAPSAPGTSLSANIDRTTHAGIEALVSASCATGNGGDRIEPLLSLTYNAFEFDGDDTYDDNRLPAAPRYFVRGEVMYRTASGFFVGPTFDLVGRRYVDFANSVDVDAHGLLGARAGFVADRLEVFAEGRNLLDRDYVAAVVVKDRANDSLEVLHPGAPRSMYVGMRYRF